MIDIIFALYDRFFASCLFFDIIDFISASGLRSDGLWIVINVITFPISATTFITNRFYFCLRTTVGWPLGL